MMVPASVQMTRRCVVTTASRRRSLTPRRPLSAVVSPRLDRKDVAHSRYDIEQVRRRRDADADIDGLLAVEADSES